VLADFQALFAGAAADELDLGVGQTLGRQPRQHLMPEQMQVDVLRDAGCSGSACRAASAELAE